jgi:hypothetical protein
MPVFNDFHQDRPAAAIKRLKTKIIQDQQILLFDFCYFLEEEPSVAAILYSLLGCCKAFGKLLKIFRKLQPNCKNIRSLLE